MLSLIEKLKKENLLGRSGSMFPVYQKWETIKNKKDDKRFVICNASEGEISTFKDYFILKNYSKIVINGIKIAIKELNASDGYIYLNKNYYDELHPILLQEIADSNIQIIKKKGGYVGGEETSIIESIEEKRPEPRIKPPFPASVGLFNYPTLVHNVETFYCIYQINEDKYNGERFYSIEGDIPKKGVYVFHKEATIREILTKSENIPNFNYFLQVGGGASGKIMIENEIDTPLCGLGSIIVHNKETTDCYKLMEDWAMFFIYNNCDKCTPCREGLFRILEMIKNKDFSFIDDIFFVMQKTSLCPLGCVAVNPFKTMLEKIIMINNENNN